MQLLKPQVSVVMATRNREGLLSAAIESICMQEEKSFELIIVDDASEDKTFEVLKDWAKRDERIHVIRSEKQVGCYGARKMAMQIAKAPMIAIMDDDAISEPQRLSRQLRYLEAHQEVGVVCAISKTTSPAGEEVGEYPSQEVQKNFPKTSKAVFEHLYTVQNHIPDYSVMFRKKLLKITGGYPEDSQTGMDTYFWLQLASKGVAFSMIEEKLVSHLSDQGRQTMVSNRKIAFEGERHMLIKVKAWLKAQSITCFDYLHEKAIANHFLRQARFYGSWKGAWLALLAFVVAPSHKPVHAHWQQYGRKVFN